MAYRSIDEGVDQLARRQRGTFSRSQVVRLGATEDEIRTRLASGRWRRLDNAVYVLPSHPNTWEQRVLAATMGEPMAVASGSTAAALHGFTGFGRTRPEITVPLAAHHESRLARVRRSGLIVPTTCEGIPTNDAAITLFELAGRFPLRTNAAIESALRSKATTMNELIEWFGTLEHSRRPGLKLMRALLERRGGTGYVPSESELEAQLYRVLDIPEFQPFVRQAPAPWDPTGRQRVDGLIERGRVIIEGDSHAWHAGFEATKRDHRRDRLAAAHGYTCLRYFWDELRTTPSAVRAEVRSVLAERRSAA